MNTQLNIAAGFAVGTVVDTVNLILFRHDDADIRLHRHHDPYCCDFEHGSDLFDYIIPPSVYRPALEKAFADDEFGPKLTDRGVRLEGVRRKPRFRVGVSPPDTANGVLMAPLWFRTRGYKHFDAQVGDAYAMRLESGSGFGAHSWSPLIHYVKRVKHYNPKKGLTVYKERPIMYASHRDACILSKYAFDLTQLLDNFYKREGLTSSVIGYRRLGKSNYDFSADAFRFAKAHSPCIVLCFDVTGFFDNLNHPILKERLQRFLDVTKLPRDWFQVLRHVTKFSYVNRDALADHPEFGSRMQSTGREPLATIAEVKTAGIKITTNPNPFGIPQGTPISSVFSNLYMTDIDQKMAHICNASDALYQRYSDDIIIVCSADQEEAISSTLMSVINSHKLEIKAEKTERFVFDKTDSKTFQYLGFNINPKGATIRPGSMARQWRKLKYSIKRTRKIANDAISAGKSDKVFTKRLRRRFSPVGSRNFSAYARRAGNSFSSKQIVRQISCLERAADAAIRDLKGVKPISKSPPPPTPSSTPR